MTLTPGTHIGHYQVTGFIGRGGMGEVYRARDTQLNREVALKVLPENVAGSSERLSRFRREAQTLASLNHPNIGAIYGLEDSTGSSALVLELVDGPTLADKIARGAIGIGEILAIAHQVAEAIEAAHDESIIHRDLKPANIKVRDDGKVKVLDFGLAKALDGDAAALDRSEASTLTAPSTREGVVLGTPAYMSPEQARGLPVDRRTDIWAFGCILYEMLAGRAAFGGATTADIMASILEREPDWERLPEATPDGVRRVLRRCLDKQPRRRLHDIADVRIEIEDATATPPESIHQRRSWTTGARWALGWGLAAAAVLLATLSGSRLVPAKPPVQPVRILHLTDLKGLEENPAFSPDGRAVAFTATVGNARHVFVQLMAGNAPLQLTSDPGDHEYPRWSPDSSAIVYFSPAGPGSAQGALWEIPALGGRPRKLVDSLGGADVLHADGRLAFFRLSGDQVELVSAVRDGSASEVIAVLPPVTYYLYPRWSPDGRWIAFQRGDSIRFDLFVVPAGGGEPRRMTQDDTMIDGLAWLPDSSGIVYSSSRGTTMPYLPMMNLWHVRLADGALRQITWGDLSYHQPDVGANGATVISRLQLTSDIWRFPVDGTPQENVRRGVRLTAQTSQILTPTAGPRDGEIAFLSDRGGHANLWVIDTETHGLRQITDERDPHVAVGAPVWSPDGRSITFVYSRGNPGYVFGVWLVNPDGSNLRQLVNPAVGPAWSHDGRWVYYSTRGSAADANIVMRKVPVEGGPPVTVTEERPRNVIGSDGSTLYYTIERPLVDGRPEFEIHGASPENAPSRAIARIPASRVPMWQVVNPTLSPDGKWLAQALTEGSTTDIWIVSSSGGEWRQVTDFGQRPVFIARRVSWSQDGRAIFAALGEGDADIVLLEGLESVTHP